ncbi:MULTISPECIES: LPD1 domain-containing protein [Bacillati]|uniref:LPD1 domain-containing protein n=1 Tax=Bacillati TaxID=1783272 RepID=UPI00341B0087
MLQYTSLRLDKRKVGKYWSSNVELTARVFEAYIATKLKERNMRSDYLVYGLDYLSKK